MDKNGKEIMQKTILVSLLILIPVTIFLLSFLFAAPQFNDFNINGTTTENTSILLNWNITGEELANVTYIFDNNNLTCSIKDFQDGKNYSCANDNDYRLIYHFMFDNITGKDNTTS